MKPPSGQCGGGQCQCAAAILVHVEYTRRLLYKDVSLLSGRITRLGALISSAAFYLHYAKRNTRHPHSTAQNKYLPSDWLKNSINFECRLRSNGRAICRPHFKLQFAGIGWNSAGWSRVHRIWPLISSADECDPANGETPAFNYSTSCGRQEPFEVGLFPLIIKRIRLIRSINRRFKELRHKSG